MYASIVFLPLFGALIAGWLSLSHRDRAAELVTVSFLLLSLLFSIIAIFQVAIGGQPLTLDAARVEALRTIWQNGDLPDTITRTRNRLDRVLREYWY
ncbi:MAG: hypothetical protein VX113_06995 [Pseudomonadota bacterium]|nr:hypothetical protein [Pseudomonadota bacterium]